MTEIPPWFSPAELAAWPTRPVEVETVRCALRVHEEWPAVDTKTSQTRYPETRFAGRFVSEGLSIQLIPAADPAVPLTDLVFARLNLVGHPLATVTHDAGVEVLAFEDFGSHAAVAAALGVDDVHSLGGLARITAPERELARFYIVLARRGRTTWNFNLSFMSASLPGTPADLVTKNDHVRAGATFGFLKLI